MYSYINNLLQLTKEAVSPWHTVAAAEKRLQEGGFQELSLGKPWQLERNKSYYVKIYGSSLLAFVTGEGDLLQDGALRMAAAHTDFPGLRIKPAASIVKDSYGVLNVETYGGLILSSWQDRPLSIAGKVMLKGSDAFHPVGRLVDFARPLMIIPSLAIHMNRKVNEGVAIKKQKEMLPLISFLGKDGSKEYFQEYLARELGCASNDILAYELNVYPYEGGCQLGMAGEFVSAGRLDNITSVEACLSGILAASRKPGSGISLIALFDNEEIGSRTKQGAGSGILLQVLDRIYTGLGEEVTKIWPSINNGFMLSVDVAHGLHPNYTEKADPTNRPLLNEGVVLKQAASQAYAGDAEAVAIVAALCEENDIPYQHFVNNSDQPGGSTLGSIASALVPIRTMDIGVPILAMHSARETMGAVDQLSLNRLLQCFLAW